MKIREIPSVVKYLVSEWRDFTKYIGDYVVAGLVGYVGFEGIPYVSEKLGLMDDPATRTASILLACLTPVASTFAAHTNAITRLEFGEAASSVLVKEAYHKLVK